MINYNKLINKEEIIFVISDSGTIHSEKGDFQINQGDSYHFEIKEKYFIEGDNLLWGIMNAPKWTFPFTLITFRRVDKIIEAFKYVDNNIVLCT